MKFSEPIAHTKLELGDKFRIPDSTEPEIVYVMGIDGLCRRLKPDPAFPDFVFQFKAGDSPMMVRRVLGA